MLSGEDIDALLDDGILGWNGSVRGDALLITLGGCLQELVPVEDPIDPYDASSTRSLYASPRTDWQEFVLVPGRMVLCSAREALALPATVSGMLGSLSHVARLGLMTHLDSPVIDAGSRGKITLELFNCGPSAIRLRVGMPVAKMVLTHVSADRRPMPERHRLYEDETWLGSRFSSEFASGDVRPS